MQRGRLRLFRNGYNNANDQWCYIQGALELGTERRTTLLTLAKSAQVVRTGHNGWKLWKAGGINPLIKTQSKRLHSGCSIGCNAIKDGCRSCVDSFVHCQPNVSKLISLSQNGNLTIESVLFLFYCTRTSKPIEILRNDSGHLRVPRWRWHLKVKVKLVMSRSGLKGVVQRTCQVSRVGGSVVQPLDHLAVRVICSRVMVEFKLINQHHQRQSREMWEYGTDCDWQWHTMAGVKNLSDLSQSWSPTTAHPKGSKGKMDEVKSVKGDMRR